MKRRVAEEAPPPRSHEIEAIIEEALAGAMNQIVMPRINAIAQEVASLRKEVEQLKSELGAIEKLVANMGANWMYAAVSSAVTMIMERLLPTIAGAIQKEVVKELGSYIKEVEGSGETVSQAVSELSEAIGNISSAIEEVRNAVKGLSNRISVIEKRLDDVEGSVSSAISEIRSAVTSMSARMDSIEREVRRIAGEGGVSGGANLLGAIEEVRKREEGEEQ